MRFLPHLVQVNEKYRDKGVEIIMATDVDKADALAKFVAEKGLKLGVARVPDVYKLVKASGYPTSYGIDVDGRCIWRGHPQGLNDTLVDGWLKDMRAPKLPRELAAQLAGAAQHYNAGKYGSALEAAGKLLKHKDEKVKADAQYLADILQGRADMYKAAAEQFKKDGYHDKLADVLELAASEFDDDFGKDSGKEAKKVKGTKAYKACVEAREELATLKETLKGKKGDDRAKAVDKFKKDHGETPYGKEAEELRAEPKEPGKDGH
ncbi:MAG: hypothetical protein HS108_15555 [Planctomycetes bacterium]|jgi:hypothetical protein|nr:hypothetical protein [Planctomycetota bacterium]